MMQRILVTGSEGYIGTVLVDHLIKLGYKVTGLDAGYFTHTVGSKPQTAYLLDRRDIRDIKSHDLKNIDIVIHLAALSNDIMGEIRPEATRQINCQATKMLAIAAKKAGVKRFLFYSSCSIYGQSGNKLVDENSPVDPQTEYARSKIAAEAHLLKLASDSFCVTIMRNATVCGYSPKFRSDLVVNNLLSTALTTGNITIKSDGSPWRPIIDIRDLSSLTSALIKQSSSLINGQIFNIGFTENNFQIKDIASIIANVLPDCLLQYTNETGKDTRSYRVAFTKIKNLIPKVSPQWSLRRSIVYMKRKLTSDKKATMKIKTGAFERITELRMLIQNGTINDMLYRKNR